MQGAYRGPNSFHRVFLDLGAMRGAFAVLGSRAWISLALFQTLVHAFSPLPHLPALSATGIQRARILGTAKSTGAQCRAGRGPALRPAEGRSPCGGALMLASGAGETVADVASDSLFAEVGPDGLEAGVVLVAAPEETDHFFRHSVVLLLDHTPQVQHAQLPGCENVVPSSSNLPSMDPLPAFFGACQGASATCAPRAPNPNNPPPSKHPENLSDALGAMPPPPPFSMLVGTSHP